MALTLTSRNARDSGPQSCGVKSTAKKCDGVKRMLSSQLLCRCTFSFVKQTAKSSQHKVKPLSVKHVVKSY